MRFMFLGFKGKQGVLDDGGKDFKGCWDVKEKKI